MLQALLETNNETLTENGALAWRTSGSACLDLFGSIGASRGKSNAEIERLFIRAYAEDSLVAMKILFFARDIRGGLGERRVFRVIYTYMLKNGIHSAIKNLKNISEFGRYDDLIALLPLNRSEILPIIKKQWEEDVESMEEGQSVSLLAKWLPSVNTSNRENRRLAHLIARLFGMTPASYRKLLTALRKRIDILENYLREKNYTFDYAKQPAKAMLKYRQAFWKNDEDCYEKFLDDVDSGKTAIHTDTLYPYEIIVPFLENATPINDKTLKSLETTWYALPDYTRGENSIVVVDGSGSMYGSRPMPASIALSLGLYFAERNHGAFYGYFITFSMTPQLVKVTGKNLRDRILHAASYNEVANTNISAVFDLILKSAIRHNVPQSELPKRIYIISDMEFDDCAKGASVSNFTHAQKMFSDAGYELPQIVFWNVDNRHNTQPVRQNEQGVVLVSGCSPSIFSLAMEGNIDPYKAMLEAINQPRYDVIEA